MNKEPLQKLFDAMYHGKIRFEDFLYSPMEQNYEQGLPNHNGRRRILKPRENLKTFHKFLNLFLFELLPINERVVYSYRKGFSAVNAVEKHRDGKFFFQTDISAFFESIDVSLAKRVILSGAEFTPISDVDSYIDRIIDLVFVNDSLPVGFPVSAPLSNAVLFDFDNVMESYCLNKGLVYTRYSDDIVISGNEREWYNGVDDFVQRSLHESASDRFYINRKKTRFFQVGNRLSILGVMILPNGKVSPDTRKRREIEVLLHFYLTDKDKFKKMIAEKRVKSGKISKIDDGVSDDECLDVLSGNLNYIDSIDPDYTNKLRRKFGVATIDMLKHRGFSK
ncbi:hypothetical protein J9978_04605 [Chromobacterium violaceum]|uniref:reverse transcriptase domain-containing protein n=1 Tax=Chromobacterium violaceum TaxID=536 RepID=UPI001B3304AC|nr:reverse transcriptase domain-containing protein [Chromobacterium violaceum]MBP4048776.1 hypothetical protein [Chromobacterium violaceum]